MYYGIFGYNFIQKVENNYFDLIPVYSSSIQVKELASKNDGFYLTGFLNIKETSRNSKDIIFIIETILSFIDQYEVLIYYPFENLDINPLENENYPLKIIGTRLNGYGYMICEDAYFKYSRSDFINKIFQLLINPANDLDVSFKYMFFKHVECLKMRKIFIDINYYLLFSGLESLARTYNNDFENSCCKPITLFLQKYDFDVCQESIDLRKSISTYTHLRNALFHNGKLEISIMKNKNIVNLKITDYYYLLYKLVALLVLKYIQFDDEHINWNGWLERNILR